MADPGPFGTGALTTLDKRVVAALSKEKAQRARDVAIAAVPGLKARLGWWPHSAQADLDVEDVRGVLRGLEHLGKATGRGGWWRAL